MQTPELRIDFDPALLSSVGEKWPDSDNIFVSLPRAFFGLYQQIEQGSHPLNYSVSNSKDNFEIARHGNTNSYQFPDVAVGKTTLDSARKALQSKGLPEDQIAFVFHFLLQHRLGVPIKGFQALTGVVLAFAEWQMVNLETDGATITIDVDPELNVRIGCKARILDHMASGQSIGDAEVVYKIDPQKKVTIEQMSLTYTNPAHIQRVEQIAREKNLTLQTDNIFSHPMRYSKKYPERTTALVIGAIATVAVASTGIGAIGLGIAAVAAYLYTKSNPKEARKITDRIKDFVMPLSVPKTYKYEVKRPRLTAEKREPATGIPAATTEGDRHASRLRQSAEVLAKEAQRVQSAKAKKYGVRQDHAEAASLLSASDHEPPSHGIN